MKLTCYYSGCYLSTNNETFYTSSAGGSDGGSAGGSDGGSAGGSDGGSDGGSAGG